MMKRKMTIRWHLRELMAAHAMWKTTDLVGPLAERGVVLSREQVYRLVTTQPERLNMAVLAALCDIFECSPSDLIEPVAEARTVRKKAVAGGPAGGPGEAPLRPVRARITDRPLRPAP